MTAVAIKVNKGLETMGLNWFVPMINLVSGENPRKQLQVMAKQIGIPILGIGIFLLVWAAVAPAIKTSIGNLPGPVAVWAQAENLAREWSGERAAAAQWRAGQEARRSAWDARFPDAPYKILPYAGKPTFVDQIFTSLKTVFTGFLVATAIAVPLGILAGLSTTFYTALSPFIAIFKPVSPLAWLPVVAIVVAGTYTSADPWFEKSFLTSAVVVALCSLWPTLINTAVGVASIDKDHMNVARVLNLGPWKKLTKIVLPSALPLMFTGLRLSLGVGWMVLIAAEMLSQNPGLGQFINDMYATGSSSSLAAILVAVIVIGIVGFALDRVMVGLQNLVSYNNAVAVH